MIFVAKLLVLSLSDVKQRIFGFEGLEKGELLTFYYLCKRQSRGWLRDHPTTFPTK